MTANNRTPWGVTWSVWKALFLREATDRLFGGRAAWVWLLFEPAMHIAFIMVMFTVVRQRVVDGMETPVWVMTGLLAYFVFGRIARQTITAIKSNRALFIYRQVRPVDTIIVRSFLEFFLVVLISLILFAGAVLFGLDVAPDEPLLAILAVAGLWLFGLGFGLVASIPVTIVAEAGKVVGLIMPLLYLASGVIFPISRIPNPYHDWLLLNPILHGVEAVRRGFGSYYHGIGVSELDLPYLYGSAIVLIFFGLAMQLRFALRLTAQ